MYLFGITKLGKIAKKKLNFFYKEKPQTVANCVLDFS